MLDNLYEELNTVMLALSIGLSIKIDFQFNLFFLKFSSGLLVHGAKIGV